MLRTRLVPLGLAGLALVAGCQDTPTGIPTAGPASLAITTGETFSYIQITNPTVTSTSLVVGTTKQMVAKLFYNLGGTLPSIPYGQWRSTNECVASVTNGPTSYGLVKAITAGTAQIIVQTWGKADTVTVTVTGTGNLDPACLERQWLWDYTDVSFTGTPASSYSVAPGEILKKVVLFAKPKPEYTILVGNQVTLRSELWYNLGGKLNGRGYVTFSTTDPTVAVINSLGVIKGLAPGRTKVIARLGTTFADTVPMYVN